MDISTKRWIWLSSVPGIGAVKSKKLLEHFGDINNIWYAKRDELSVLPFLNRTDVSNLMGEERKTAANDILNSVNKYGIKVITIESDTYPSYLKNIYDPPPVLYMRGSIEREAKYLAIVGSRKATSYGVRAAQTISMELSKYGITVVSGMARGIDSFAIGCIRCGGRTVAVIGCGLDIIYPYENKRLMKHCGKRACISEYPPGTTLCQVISTQ